MDMCNTTPYDNFNHVAKCETCGRPIFKCVCPAEDEEDDEWQDDGVNGDYSNAGEPNVDGFGRNYSDADPGL